MVLVGLTGGIATGKSTVARMFRQCGAVVIDADQLARAVVRPGRPAWREIVRAFGRTALNPIAPSIVVRWDSSCSETGPGCAGLSASFTHAWRGSKPD
jgi:hypothetical protein